MKKVALLIALMIIFSGCAPIIMQQVAQGITQNTTSQLAQSPTTQRAAQNAKYPQARNGRNCIPRMSGGQVSFYKIIQKQIMTVIIENALKGISNLKGVKYPRQIQDTCEADARLRYVNSLTNQYYNNLFLLNMAILDSIKQTDEVVKIKAAMKDRNNIKDQAEINDKIEEQNDQIMELIKSAQIRDRNKVSEAWGIFNESFFKYTPLIVAWDKEIAEFGQDNIVWALKNFGAVKTTLTQLKSIGALFVNGKDALTNFLASNNVTINKKVAKRKAREISRANKKVLRKSQKEFEKDFNS